MPIYHLQMSGKPYRVEFWGGHPQHVQTRKRFQVNGVQRESWTSIWRVSARKRPGATAKTAIEAIYKACYESRDRYDPLRKPPDPVYDKDAGYEYHPLPDDTVKPTQRYPAMWVQKPGQPIPRFQIQIKPSRDRPGRLQVTIYVRVWTRPTQTEAGRWQPLEPIRIADAGTTAIQARVMARDEIAIFRNRISAPTVPEQPADTAIPDSVIFPPT